MENEISPMASLVPMCSLLGTWVVKRIMVFLGAYSKGREWVLPVSSVLIGVIAGTLLQMGDAWISGNAPEWIGPLWGAFSGAAATGFHQMARRGQDGLKERRNHIKFPESSSGS